MVRVRVCVSRAYGALTPGLFFLCVCCVCVVCVLCVLCVVNGVCVVCLLCVLCTMNVFFDFFITLQCHEELSECTKILLFIIQM